MRAFADILLKFARATILIGCALMITGITGPKGRAETGQSEPNPAAVEEGQPNLPADKDAAEPVVIEGQRLESVLGREVRTKAEEQMGRVVDLLCDRMGKVEAAVIEFGGFLGIGTRKIAIEWSALRFDADGKTP